MKIKNHQILHEISRGSLTTVYKARHLNLDRFVLLKVLNSQWLQEADLLERFRREAQISAQINHPNIVRVYDFEVSTELVYISMEYVEGQTLQQFLEAEHPVSFDTGLQIFEDIVQALVYTHERGIIHRDIKPANIMIDQNSRARLTDFGLAHLSDIPAVTEQGQSMGTPAYMAPEVVQGAASSVQSDLYSTGLTMYELLRGESPFNKENMAATLHAVLSEDAPDLSQFRQDIPPWLLNLINEMIAKNAENRPQNALDVLARLKEKSSAGGSVKEAQSPSPVTTKKKMRWPIYAGLLIAAIVLLILGWQQFGEVGQVPGSAKNTALLVPADTLFNSGGNTKSASMINDSEGNGSIAAGMENQKSAIIDAKEASRPIAKSNTEKRATGYFYPICTPWAKIVIDGDSVDMTPLAAPIELPPGKHLVELVNPNFKISRQWIETMENQIDTLNVRLEPAFGYLNVKASPWAKIFIDGEYKEATPLTNPLILTTGRHILRVVNPNYGVVVDTVHIELDKTVEKHYTLRNTN
ncbi:MAG: serine/threonine protein kinase [Calditrichaeota bacterium]|nr:MAG: serine/threonine protein kinase [Calditrichota bacterium]